MKYSEYKINDTVEINGQNYTLLDDRIAKGKDKKKAMTAMTILSFAMLIGLYLLLSFLITLIHGEKCYMMTMPRLFGIFGLFVVLFAVFIVAHELLHYATYRFIGGTPKDMLKFGVVLKSAMAYCISLVPNSVKSSRLSLMMPIYVMIIPMCIITVAVGSQYLAIMTAAFFSGSAGDIWYMWTLRKTDKDLYMMEEMPEGKEYELGYYVFKK